MAASLPCCALCLAIVSKVSIRNWSFSYKGKKHLSIIKHLVFHLSGLKLTTSFETIDHFTKPLNKSEAGVDLLWYCIKAWSTQASLLFKGVVTEHRTVKWSIHYFPHVLGVFTLKQNKLFTLGTVLCFTELDIHRVKANTPHPRKMNCIMGHAKVDRPLPSCCLPRFRSESWCSTIVREMSLICIRIRNSFSFEWLCTRTRFETEACSNSEMGYWGESPPLAQFQSRQYVGTIVSWTYFNGLADTTR